jgi:Protein of unknown function (DUF2844)
MRLTWTERARVVGAVVAITALPAGASAALGGDASTVDADRVRMQGSLLRIARSDAYTLHEVRSASGIMVRQFVSSNGTVFGVAWEGPWMPDLRQLLGSSYEQYTQAATRARRARKGHGPLLIEQGDLVVQVSGHARAFSGRAYLAHLVPPGVAMDLIR